MPLATQEQLKRTVASKTSPSFRSCPPRSQLHGSSLNVGVGAGALYMLITCHEEMKKLNKTVEETENLVEELKQQLQRHHEGLGSQCGHSAEDGSSPSSNLHADVNYTGRPPAPSSTCKLDEFLEEQVPATRGTAKDQMAALAAELEAELELMELNIQAEDTLPLETLTHDAGEVSSKGIANSYYSDTSSHGMLEASDIGRPSAHYELSHMDCGVSAIELDHRLREVLEAQQQERILELEQLLKDTKAKLLAKEHEVICWKNHVNSLTDLLQPPSTHGTRVLRLNKPNGAESVTVYDNFVASVPEVTKSTVDLLHSFQDPPISTQVNYLEASSTSDLLADAYEQETSPHSSSAHGFSNEKRSLNEAPISASPFFTSSMDSVKKAGESEYWLDYQGAGIDTPEYVFMKELDTYSAQKTEIPRSEVLSKALERDDCMLYDGWSSEMRSRYSSSDYISSLLTDVDENDTPSGRTGLDISRLQHMTSCRLGIDENPISPSNFFRTKELERDSDVKHIVDFIMQKPTLLDAEHAGSGEEAMQAPKRNLKSKNKHLQQLVTKGSNINRSVELASPVLDKIKHFEALGSRPGEKRI